MAEDHTGHNNGRFDEYGSHKAQCELTFKEREDMMMYELDPFSEGFLFTPRYPLIACNTCSGH